MWESIAMFDTGLELGVIEGEIKCKTTSKGVIEVAKITDSSVMDPGLFPHG